MVAGGVAAFLIAAQVAATINAPKPAPAAVKPVKMSVAKPAPKPAVVPVAETYIVKSILPVKSPFVHGDWYWNEAVAPANAASKIVVTVDLKAQVLSVFRDGHEIGTAVMIYGADAKPTPLGVFQVSFRKAKHVSSLYNAPMPYTLRLTNDGVSIHGSEAMRPDAATHGCVGVPIAFARKLFDVVKLGDTVIVSNGETLAQGQAITAA